LFLQFAMTFSDDSGRSISLDHQLGSGGEAKIYAVSGHDAQVAKIYLVGSPERSAKLRAMVSSPPADPTAGQGHVSICWPKSLLLNRAKACVGFLMHRVDYSTHREVFHFYNPQSRQQIAPGFTWGYLLRTAANIASVVEAVHTCGYVVGDLNESNFLVSEQTLVTLVDCDSMQVPKAGGRGFFRCTVGKPDFTAPELQKCGDFSQIDRDQTHDNFALGVMIFHLLMEGVHPYTGVWKGRGDPPPIEERIRSGDCAYVGSANVAPMPTAVSFDILPASLKALVVRCFGYGHRSPATRPSAREWRDALKGVERNLTPCSAKSSHVYANHLAVCPWCERKVLWGFDPFPLAQVPLPSIGFVSAPPKPPRSATPSTTAPPPPRLSIWSVIGTGILGSLLLGLSGSTILFVSRMSTPTGRNTSLPFTNADDNPFWIVGLIAGIAFRLLSRVSRRAAVLGITLIVLCATIWYNVANRQSPAISPAPSYPLASGSVGGQNRALVSESSSASPQPQPPSAPAISEPTKEDTLPAPAVDPKQTTPAAQDAEGPSKGQGQTELAALPGSQIPAPMIAAFEAIPPTVDQCDFAILRWDVQGASSVSIEPGIGVVDATSGHKLLRPVQTARYTLKADGPGGAVSRDVTLSVVSATKANCGH